jgi:hypothetical protein
MPPSAEVLIALVSISTSAKTKPRKQATMHVCQPAKLSSKIRCPICGQDFLIYAETGVSTFDTMSCRVIEHALRTHHTPTSVTPSAHPDSTFHIPNWNGTRPFLASAALSDLLDSGI